MKKASSTTHKTKIEWTEIVWNPVTGCTKLSVGCKNCYAERMASRLKLMGNPRYINGFDVTVHEDLIDVPLLWKKPQMVFVNSMSDLFHDDVPDEVILKIFKTMNEANWHIFQVLTKRTDRLAKLSDKINWTPNIWMGVSVENVETTYRIKDLTSTGAKMKFISAEPLLESLGPVDLRGINWLIVGGESGPHSRAMEKDWVIELKGLAEKYKVAFYFKQWGGTNKKATGSMLDGIEYKAMPKMD